MANPDSGAERNVTEPQPTASPRSDADLKALFARIPRVDAVRRRPRFGGLVGWGARQWVALAATAAVMFGLLQGFGASTSWGVSWTAIVVVASLLSGFVLASYVPRPGTTWTLSTCSLMPLVGTLLVPTIMNSSDVTTGVLGLGLLAALASQRVTGAGC